MWIGGGPTQTIDEVHRLGLVSLARTTRTLGQNLQEERSDEDEETHAAGQPCWIRH